MSNVRLYKVTGSASAAAEVSCSFTIEMPVPDDSKPADYIKSMLKQIYGTEFELSFSFTNC